MARLTVVRVVAGSEANDYDVLPRLQSYSAPADPLARWVHCLLLPPLCDDRRGQLVWQRCWTGLRHYYNQGYPLQICMRTLRHGTWRWLPIATGIPSALTLEGTHVTEDTCIVVDAILAVTVTLTLTTYGVTVI